MRSFLLLSGFLCLTNLSVFSQAGEEDKSLSPYFWVKSESGNVEQMPLKHTSADINIAGVIAEVEVTQVYQNEGKVPLEATYVFPASTRAAIFAMEMRVGHRRIKAQIKERQAARQLYEAAKQEGKTASLLEQERPNIFTMNVANILPGDSIVVKLSYTELLKPEKGIYEFVYPTVVGPRYTGPQGPSTAPGTVIPTNQPDPEKKKGDIPYTPAGKAPTYTFGLKAAISAGMPVQQVISPSHNIEVDFSRGDVAKVELDESELNGGNRDFVIRYRLSGKEIQPGLLTYEENGEKFFLLMMQPPKVVEPEKIPPREYIFVVDVSGSMNGFPLNTAKLLMHDLLGNIRPTDRFNVVLFEHNNQVFAPNSVQATPKNIKEATDFMLSTRGGGGTNLYNGIQAALDMKGTSDYSRHIVAVTDGYISAEAKVFDLIRKNLGEANFWSFGIGSGVNRFLIEGLAHVGQGEPLVVLSPLDVKDKAQKFKEYIETPALTNVKVDFDLSQVYDIEPSSVPDVMAERPILIMGKYKDQLAGQWKITGLSGQDEWLAVVPMGEGVRPKRRNRAVRYLWARERIKLLGDYEQFGSDSNRVAEITQLGIDYNLLTKYTSFVAIDERIRNETGQDTAVTQPLPLPEGVSNQAVGNIAGKGNPVITSQLQIRGSTISPAVYYIDGQRVRGLSSLTPALSLSEVVVATNSVLKYASTVGSDLSVQGNQSWMNNSQFQQEIIGAASGMQNGQGTLLIDGIPLFMGLGNQDGIRNIPYFWINNLQFHPTGTTQKQGYEALHGGMNMMLWNQNPNTLAAEVRGDAFGGLNVGIKGKYNLSKAIKTRLFLDGNSFQQQIDRNTDGFADVDKRKHFKLMNIWNGSHHQQQFYWSAGIYGSQVETEGGQFENEQNPTASLFDWNSTHRQIAGFAKASWAFANTHHLQFQTTAQKGQQKGTWSNRLYSAEQRHIESQLLYQKSLTVGSRYLYLTGGFMYRNTFTHEVLENQLLSRRESVPGALVKANLALKYFAFQGELRADQHNLYGLLLHPRIAASFSKKAFKANAIVYRGTRPANLFNENLQYLKSNRQWELPASNFVPDQGWKYHLSTEFFYNRSKFSATVGGGYTRSHYTSLMLTDLQSDSEVIRFYPAEGNVSRDQFYGVVKLRLFQKIGLKGRYYFDNFRLPFVYGIRPQPFTARHRGILTLSYASKGKPGDKFMPWKASVTAMFVGPQFVPYQTDIIRPGSWRSFSDSYITLSAELRREFKKFYLFAGVDNLTDYRQSTLVLAPESVESTRFDASLVWGPALGRRVYGGIGFSLGK